MCDVDKTLDYATWFRNSPCVKVPPNSSSSSLLTTVPQGRADTMIDRSQEGIDALYPAVIECFSVILLGYVAGKTGLVSPTETKGLNTFIGTFSLPALVFVSIAQLDLGAVNWPFILGIGLGKTTVFVIVLLISLLVTKQCDKSGLFAIFCSQSNDFAMGYPILYALYGKEYADYLYLLGPVSLVILNPIGFVFMEISKQNNLEKQAALELTGVGRTERHPPATLVVIQKVLVGVVLNPVVLMTALGIGANFTFHHCLPQTLAGILQMLGSAFSASALFSLGLTMVGSAATMKGAGFVVPGILIAVKLIMLPVISREFVNLLDPGALANETVAMTNYAFLYGTLPTAPGVFVFACHYGIYVEMIAGAMVACTFVSAPLMFLAAKMIALRDLNPADYIDHFSKFLLDVSAIGLIASIWVVILFVVSQKWKKIPHCITLCLVLSQALGCLGALLWSLFEVDLNNSSVLYLQFSIFSFGMLSARVWTGILATTLVFLRCRSFCFVLRMRPWMMLIGWGIPGLITAILLLAVKRETDGVRQNPLFQYGNSQAMVSALVLLVCFIVTVGCLVLQQRYERKYTQYRGLLTSGPLPSESRILEEDDEESLLENENGGASSTTLNCGGCPQAPGCDTRHGVKSRNVSEIEELVDSEDDDQSLFNYNGDLCSPTKFPCDAVQRRHCRQVLDRYRGSTQLTADEEIGIVRDRDDEYQILRHIVLLILLSISMFVGIALCLWTLVMEDLSGIYVELMFVDAALNFGQGFFTFMLFGLNTQRIFMPVAKWWRRFFYGDEILHLPKLDEVSPETRHVCQQFLTYHLAKCGTDIAKDRRWRMESYSKVFSGHELINWLILVGLAKDRGDGVQYGKHLVNGRLLRHVKNLHHFHDQAFFYTLAPPN